jgi:hypothetical protein
VSMVCARFGLVPDEPCHVFNDLPRCHVIPHGLWPQKLAKWHKYPRREMGGHANESGAIPLEGVSGPFPP